MSCFSAAARWRNVYSVFPFMSSRYGYSSGIGSFTFTIMSDVLKMSSLVAIVAPLKMYASSS